MRMKLEGLDEVHQALLSQIVLLADFFLRKLPFNEECRRVLELVNLTPERQNEKTENDYTIKLTYLCVI